LEKAEKQTKISFEDSYCIIPIETIGDLAEAGLVTKGIKEKCPFIRVK